MPDVMNVKGEMSHHDALSMAKETESTEICRVSVITIRRSWKG